jgi:hypothetical protein
MSMEMQPSSDTPATNTTETITQVLFIYTVVLQFTYTDFIVLFSTYIIRSSSNLAFVENNILLYCTGNIFSNLTSSQLCASRRPVCCLP